MRLSGQWSRGPLLLIAALATVSCSEGPAGAAGPMGPDGQPGDPAPAQPTMTGVVDVPGNSPAPEGVPVVAVRVAPDGQDLSPVAVALTDASGNYELTLPLGAVAGSDLKIIAHASGHRLSAITTSLDQDVTAVTTGVARILASTVAAAGGLGMDDFDAAEIDGLVTAADAALVAAGTDLADAEAVFQLLLDSIGAEIVAAAGGSVTASANALAVSSDPPGVESSVTLTHILTDGEGRAWDVGSNGVISDGQDDAWDTFFELTLDGADFAADSVVLRDDRSVVFRETNAGATGLDVTRTIYVSPTSGFARYTESFANPSGAAISVEVGVGGNLGSSEDTDGIFYTGSDDGLVGESDEWVVAKAGEPGDTPSAWIFPGALPSKSGDDLDVTWSIDVPAGQRVTIFHFAFQGGPEGEGELVELMVELAGVPSAGYYVDVPVSDATAALRGARTVSVEGDAGSVAPRERLTLTNTDTGESETRFARRDGSFRSDLAASAGDVITVTGDRGTQLTLTAQ